MPSVGAIDGMPSVKLMVAEVLGRLADTMARILLAGAIELLAREEPHVALDDDGAGHDVGLARRRPGERRRIVLHVRAAHDHARVEGEVRLTQFAVEGREDSRRLEHRAAPRSSPKIPDECPCDPVTSRRHELNPRRPTTAVPGM